MTTDAGPAALPAVAVLIEPTSFPVFPLAAGARGLCRPVWVCDVPTLEGRERGLRRFGPVVDVHDRPGQDVVDELRSLGAAGVVSFADRPLPYAAALAERLGLPSHTPAVARLCVDKAAQRAALADAGVPSAQAVLVARGSPVPQHVPLPAVVKPRRGEAGRDVAAAADRAAVERLVAAAQEDVVVEEMLPDLVPPAEQRDRADVVSVEVGVRGGQPTVFGITQRWPFAAPFRETGSFFPAALPADVEDGVAAVALAAARALGITDAMLHVEVKRTPTGPRIVEVNGRLGGAQSEMSVAAGGPDLHRQALLIALGRDLDPVPAYTRVGLNLVLFAPPEVRVVTAVTGLDVVAAMPGIDDVTLSKPPGSAVDPARGGLDAVVHVLGGGPDHATVSALRAGILRAVSIT